MKNSIEISWRKALSEFMESSDFEKVEQFVEEEYFRFPQSTFPAKENLFKAFESCSFDSLNVVILGQDPYPTAGHAHGLCFSCNASVQPLPKSIQNIFKELESDLGVSAPISGDLSNWSRQGVLLLNSILTVHEGLPLSHANKGWEQFTDAVIETINHNKKGIVFVLWGKPAQLKGSQIDASRHTVLYAPHPSPLSAYRGFFGSKPFSTINSLLIKQGKQPVIWV